MSFPPPPPHGAGERPPLVTQLRFPFRLFSRILSLPEEREKNSPLPLPPLLPSFRARISFIRFERSRSPREEAGFEERKEREDCQPNELDFFSPFVPSRVSLPPPLVANSSPSAPLLFLRREQAAFNHDKARMVRS